MNSSKLFSFIRKKNSHDSSISQVNNIKYNKNNNAKKLKRMNLFTYNLDGFEKCNKRKALRRNPNKSVA